ncbi:MAG: saccharopine dehydrogenase NADP-binding domain-containing protein [Thermoguttaceae bacterium]|nr:saccharopine dehydrogenase NADP-binding domain-containing protein [Thermoguttaceae bacterium]MDW8079230.1 saccharopine dehydrogenase NADP-binding domain-containing protein [Thermoguttaceae bacterium]
MAQPKWMIYGAGGFSGRLIAEEAVRRGHQPVLAGRRPESIYRLAERLGCRWMCFPLKEVGQVRENIRGLRLVLNCAGPFSQTAKVLAQAAVAARVHYLDITGEIEVIEYLSWLGGQAAGQGVSLLPAVGFGVVPTDCLAARLADKFPASQWLRIAFTADRSPSRGTAKSMWEGHLRGGRIRWAGRLEPLPLGKLVWDVDFPSGRRRCLAIPWGDLATGYRSTNIPNIVTYAAFPRLLVGILRGLYRATHPIDALRRGGKGVGEGFPKPVEGADPQSASKDLAVNLQGLKDLGGSGDSGGIKQEEAEAPESDEFGPTKRLLRAIGWKVIDWFYRDPRSEEVEEARAEIVVEIGKSTQACARAAITTPGGYRFTAVSALAAVEKCLSQPPPPGFWTPSRAFGPEFVLSLPGVEVVSLPD